ncbi:enoyl-CoA hydratase [Roseomonas elaeocarpi]|uniref:Enoyl-CoA hydratase n=1 Tax=Roseomonas elaeocarpi TaxID=907779 RepID=A0ABV6JQW7_9PROT
MAPEMIVVERHGAVGLIRLNRPKALNALCDAMMAELAEALRDFDRDPEVGAVVLTGSERAFAAGADIREMQDRRFPDTALADFIAPWEAVLTVRKPVIAAVAGFALGGGCELAMMCDTIVAAETAKFGQPEINLGIIPGAGGSQRLARAVGKAVAMDMILTGRNMDAAEALRAGLVSRVVPAERLLEEALAMGAKIAELSPAAVAMAKAAVNAAFETTLREGVRLERTMFLSLFGTAGQREGMAAFVEKRPARFPDAAGGVKAAGDRGEG